MLTRKGYFGTCLNTVLMTCGTVLCVLGCYMAYFYYFLFKLFVEPIVWISPLVIAMIGSVTFLTSIFGFCGGTFACRTLFFMFVFLITGSSIGIGSFWTKYDSPRDEQLLRSFTNYDGSFEQKIMWRELHKKFDCCGVNGPKDFNNSGRQIPNECYKSPPKRIFFNYAQNIELSKSSGPPEMVESGCGEALSNRIILDRYIIGSASLVTGLLVLLTLIASFFIVFEEEEDECESEMYNGVDLDNYYNYFSPCAPSDPPQYNFTTRTTVAYRNQPPEIQMLASCPTVPYQNNNFQTQQIPIANQFVGSTQDPSVPVMIIPISQQPSGQNTQPVQNLQPFRPFIPSPSVNPPAMVESTQPYRPVQLQMPDMSFFSSLMSSGRRRHGRRPRHGRRHYNSEPAVSIIPMPTGNGFIVCNNNERDDSDDSD